MAENVACPVCQKVLVEGVCPVCRELATDVCPVCLETPVVSDLFKRPCNHALCSRCAVQVGGRGMPCPMCRATFNARSGLTAIRFMLMHRWQYDLKYMNAPLKPVVERQLNTIPRGAGERFEVNVRNTLTDQVRMMKVAADDCVGHLMLDIIRSDHRLPAKWCLLSAAKNLMLLYTFEEYGIHPGQRMFIYEKMPSILD